MKYVKYATLVLLLAGAALAQTTIVSGNGITDPNGNLYANGTASAYSVANSGQPTFTFGPTPTDASGRFSLTVTSNQNYRFKICSKPVLLGIPTTNPTPQQVCFEAGPILIVGATQDITTQLTTAAVPIGPAVSGGTISPNAQGQVAFFSLPGTQSFLDGANGVTIDPTETVLNAMNGVTTGTSPPTACSSALGAICLGESSTYATPTPAVGILQADGINHVLLGSSNGSSFFPLPNSYLAPMTISAVGQVSTPVMLASGTNHAAGLVPDPGSTAGITRFLREDGNWQVPTGSGGGLPDPGANGIVKRTALNTTTVAVAADINALGAITNNTSGTAANLSGSQTANFIYAAPNGSAGTASFRAMVAADVPTLNQNTTGTAANLSGSQTANFVYAAPNGSSGTAAFRALVGADIPAPSYPLTIAGTVNSGGIVYANSTTQESYSGTLGSGQVVLGGGSGAAPTSSAGLTYSSGTLNAGVAGTATGVLQLSGTTSGNVTLTPSATASTLTIGGSGYSNLLLPAGTGSSVSVGSAANNGVYFPTSTVAISVGGSAQMQWPGSNRVQCLASCTYSANAITQAVTYQSGVDTTASSITGGTATFRGASITGGTTSGATSSAVMLQSGDNAATGGASQSIGNTTVTSGGFTGASGASAAWTPGYTIIAQKYWADTTTTTGTLACVTTPGTNGQMPKIGTCTVTSNVPWIGIIASTSGQSVSVVKMGHASSVVSNASSTDTAGFFVCVDTSNAGKVVVQSTQCAPGLGVGTIDQTGSGGTSHSVDVSRF